MFISMQVSTSGSGLLYVDEPALSSADASSFAVDQFSSSFSVGSPSSDDQLYVVAANPQQQQPRRQQRFVIASPSSFLSPSSLSAAAGGQHSPPQPPHCDAEVSPSTSTSSSTSALCRRAETDDFAVLKPEIDFADVAAVAVTTSAYPLSDSQLPNRLHVSTPAGVDATASCRVGGFPLPVSYGGVENQLLHVSMETGTCDTAATDCIQWNLSAAERRRTEHLSSTPCASAGPSSGSRHSDIDSFFTRYIY